MKINTNTTELEVLLNEKRLLKEEQKIIYDNFCNDYKGSKSVFQHESKELVYQLIGKESSISVEFNHSSIYFLIDGSCLQVYLSNGKYYSSLLDSIRIEDEKGVLKIKNFTSLMNDFYINKDSVIQKIINLCNILQSKYELFTTESVKLTEINSEIGIIENQLSQFIPDVSAKILFNMLKCL